MISGTVSMRAPYRKSDFLVNRQSDERLYHYCDVALKDRIRDARLAKRLTQKQLASRAGLSQTTISDIERGRNAGSSELPRIARALGLSTDALAYDLPEQQSLALPVDDQRALLTAWAMLTDRQRVDELRRLQEMAAANVDLVRQLGHLNPNLDKPVSNEYVEKHLPAVPGRTIALKPVKR